MRQRIYQRDLGPAGQHRAEVHLLGDRALAHHGDGGNDLQALQQPSGTWPAVRLHSGYYHVVAALGTPVTLTEKLAGRAGTGRDAR